MSPCVLSLEQALQLTEQSIRPRTDRKQRWITPVLSLTITHRHIGRLRATKDIARCCQFGLWFMG
jgi:hypothetical protein